LFSQFPPGRLALLGRPSEEGARTWSPSGILAWLALPLLQDFIFADIIVDLRRMLFHGVNTGQRVKSMTQGIILDFGFRIDSDTGCLEQRENGLWLMTFDASSNMCETDDKEGDVRSERA